MTAPDNLDEICAVMAHARTLAPIVICTGGLGPTRDDLTAEALAKALSLPLIESAEALQQVEQFFALRGREMSPSNRRQARIPEGAEILPNSRGTAPGIAIQDPDSLICCLPGVPHEMRTMFDDHVSPRIEEMQCHTPPIRHIIRVTGMGESVVEDRLTGLDHPGLSIAFRAGRTEHEVKLRFSPDVDTRARSQLVHDVRDRIGPRAYGVDCGDLAQVVGELLIKRSETVATAESCTAGQLSSWIARIPGASAYLIEGAVVYSNEAKIRSCGVDPRIIEDHGAVSEPVAVALARGIRERAETTWGIGITGLAGPGGARPGKPTGTVHISIAGPHSTWHRRYQFHGDRERVTERSTAEALYRLYRAVSPS